MPTSIVRACFMLAAQSRRSVLLILEAPRESSDTWIHVECSACSFRPSARFYQANAASNA